MTTMHSFQIRSADIASYLTGMAEEERPQAMTREE